MGVVTSLPPPPTSELPFDPASSSLTAVVGTLHPPPLLDNGSGALLLLSLGPHLPQTIVIEGWTWVGQWAVGTPPIPPPPGPVLCRIDYWPLDCFTVVPTPQRTRQSGDQQYPPTSPKCPLGATSPLVEGRHQFPVVWVLFLSSILLFVSKCVLIFFFFLVCEASSGVGSGCLET